MLKRKRREISIEPPKKFLPQQNAEKGFGSEKAAIL